MLCDTYEDEKKEAIEAAEALGDALDSVRLDTTGSRRGDFREIIEEVRWELDIRGYDDVGIFVSGGIGVKEVLELRDVADGFGVGGSIASVPPVDFSLDIVEVEGELAGKRGEKSGKKEVVNEDVERWSERVVPADEVDADESAYTQVLDSGEIVHKFDMDEARERVLSNLDVVEETVSDAGD
jgi:nicotinate phosphoribosyltransferase